MTPKPEPNGGGFPDAILGNRAGFIVAASVLFALCNALTHGISSLENYQVRPQEAIPFLSGYLAGPWAGFVVGFLGNLGGDALGGSGVSQGLRYALSFSAGNGIYGFLMGGFGRRRPRFDAPENLGELYSALFFIVLAGTLYAAFVEWLVFGVDVAARFESMCVAITVSNYLAVAMIIPGFLWMSGRIQKGIAQKSILFFYYFSFILTIGSVAAVLFLMRRFGFADSWNESDLSLFMYDILIVPMTAVVLAGSLASVGITRGIIKPLSDLSGEMKRLSAGGFTDRLKVDFGDDLRDLSAAYNDMTDRLAVYADEIQKAASREEHIKTELHIASKIQRTLMPEGREEIRAGNCTIFGSMVPMREIGGDFFNCFLLDDDRFFFVVADISGHGIPAALFMMAVDTTLRNLVRSGSGIEKIFTALNESLCERNSENYFVTAFAGIFDPASRRLRYVNAGHPPPYVRFGSGGFQALTGEVDLVLGAFGGETYSASEITMPEEAMLCVYTDGIVETANAEGKMYAPERLLRVLDEAAADSPRGLVERVFASVRDFVGEIDISDDATLLSIRF